MSRWRPGIRSFCPPSGRSSAVPTAEVAAVYVPRRPPAPPMSGSEAQIDADADERARIAVRDALSSRRWRTVAEIQARVFHRYRWQTVEVLGELHARGEAERRRSKAPTGGRIVARWKRRV